jgi:hypothetical protein
MARIRSRLKPGSQETGANLVEPIVAALKDVEQTDGPVIFEVPAGSTDFVQVIVVWNRWSELPADVRSRIVIEAYERAGVDVPDIVGADRISTIIPVTVGQALEMGVLSYSVQCNVHRSDPNYGRIQQLMKQEGAIETDGGTDLRLPTVELAREARDRLQVGTREMVPEVHWQITQQVGRIIDY